MTDQPRFARQQFPNPQRTEVLPQQGFQPAQGQGQYTQPYAPHWQGQQQWQQPAQQWPYQQAPLAQQGWPQQGWPQQGWPQHPGAAPGQVSADEKNAALGAYLGGFFMPILLPLIIMLAATNKPFQRAAGLQALTAQVGCMAITMLCPIVMTALLFSSRGSMSFYFGYVPMLMCWVFSAGFSIMGMTAAQKGEIQYAPLIGRRVAKAFRAEWPAA